MKAKVYLETSVISYYVSRPSRDIIIAGHQQITLEWWNRQIQLYEPYLSEVVLDEISRGDANAAQLRLKAVEGFLSVAVTPAVIKLAREYYSALQLPDKARLDAIHLALAVEHGMDFLVSWNFVHIVGARPRGIIQAINYTKGIKTPLICTPEELLEEDIS